MRVAQRYVMIAGIIIVLFPCIVFFREEGKDQFINQYETAYIERFANKICKNGGITYEDYVLCLRALSFGTCTELRICEYQREQDLEGTGYYPVVTWEEISVALYEDNVYWFSKDSIVKIIVRHREKNGERQMSRYGRSNKGAGNDT